jgi:hypothetical protein
MVNDLSAEHVAIASPRPDDLDAGLRVVEQAFYKLRGPTGLRPIAFREPAFQHCTDSEDPAVVVALARMPVSSTRWEVS